MKIEIEVKPEHWWIECREPANKKYTAEAMVRFKGNSNGKEYSHEEHHFGTPESCLEFVLKYFGEARKDGA